MYTLNTITFCSMSPLILSFPIAVIFHTPACVLLTLMMSTEHVLMKSLLCMSSLIFPDLGGYSNMTFWLVTRMHFDIFLIDSIFSSTLSPISPIILIVSASISIQIMFYRRCYFLTLHYVVWDVKFNRTIFTFNFWTMEIQWKILTEL